MNSRAGFPTYALSRGASSANLSTSPNYSRSYKKYIKARNRFFVLVGGEGGIRTHAPFRTNGFQDRLVMTTSIPLHESQQLLYHHKTVLSSFFYKIGIEKFNSLW